MRMIVALATVLITTAAYGSEIEDLRAEVKRLRAEVKMLRASNAAIKKRLAVLEPPATRPATRPSRLQKPQGPKHYRNVSHLLRDIPRKIVGSGKATPMQMAALKSWGNKNLPGRLFTVKLKIKSFYEHPDTQRITLEAQPVISCSVRGRKAYVKVCLEISADRAEEFVAAKEGKRIVITGVLDDKDPICADTKDFRVSVKKRAVMGRSLTHRERQFPKNRRRPAPSPSPGAAVEKLVSVKGWDRRRACLKVTLTDCRLGRK